MVLKKNVLAFSTSTPDFSVALLSAEGTRHAGYCDMAHAERMFAAIDEVMDGFAKSSLQAIAVDVGPGSFTGIRVGLAAAKGMALALGIPIIPVSSLAALAQLALDQTQAKHAVALVDARREEVFVGRFTRDGSSVIQRGDPYPIAVVSAAEHIAELNTPDTVLCGYPIENSPGQWATGILAPDARVIAAIGALHLNRAEPNPSLDDIEPIYVRAPDAKKPQGLPKMSLQK